MLDIRRSDGNDTSTMDLAERIERLTTPEPNTGCLLWLGALIGSGYPGIKVGRKMRRGNRVVWEAAHGPIPDGKIVMHTCDNRSCLEETHFRIGTPAENSADMVRKGRQASGDRSGRRLYPDRYGNAEGDKHWSRRSPERLNPKRGEDNHNARLTEDQVREIRSRRSSGESLNEIASVFGVTFQTVSEIARRRSWRHVDG
jgi:hypothetical protein